MIHKLGQVMIYVDNLDQAERFWTEAIGFVLVQRQTEGGLPWIEVAPTNNSGTSIVLHDKAKVAEIEPEMNVDTPSLMFFTEDINALYQEFAKKEVTLGEMAETPTGKVFNFADDEGNYFAVMEKVMT